MKKTWRSITTIIITAVLLFTVTGCSFSIGSVPEKNKEEQEDLFPDAEEDRKNFSYKAYDFSLTDLGDMTVYVDTTEGYDFELEKDNNGFNILDEDGDAVLYAACMTEEMYQSLTAEVDGVETINGRDFLYRENGDGSIDAFSYMADCGLDCGLVMESHTGEDVFRLVAFRGEALAGASSDPYDYKGDAPKADDDDSVTGYTDVEEPDEYVPIGEIDKRSATATGPDNVPAGPDSTNSFLDADVEEILASLDTDYNKINWGVTYAPFEEYPGFVVSVAPFLDFGDCSLLIGFTNLYEEPVSFSGDAVAYGADGNEVGSTFVYTGTICKGNTLIATINCGEDIPDGRISWSGCRMNFDPVKEYAAWEADVSIGGNAGDGYLTAEYSMSCVEDADMLPGEIIIILLDEKGNVLAVQTHYEDEVVASGSVCNGSFDIYQEEDLLNQTADYVMFVSPEKK